MWSQQFSWLKSLTSELWHRESSREVKGQNRNSAGVQHSQWHWWFGFSESQTDGDTDMYCPCCSEWNICSSGACTASRFPQWLTHCDFIHPQMHTNTSWTAVGRNLINPKMFCADGEKCRTPVTHQQMDKLGVDESLSGRQPLKYSLKTFRA